MIHGGHGADRISGGRGNDRLNGGAGRDTLRCGSGSDTALVDSRDLIGTDCARVLSAKTGNRLTTMADVPNSVPGGSAPPPGKACHLETRTVLVQEETGSQAQYGLDAADDVLAFTTGAPPGQPGAIGDLLWGCRSQVFPALLRPPGCA